MAASNHPEKSYFDRVIALENEIAERRIDLKAVYDEAKGTLDKDALKVLRAAVRRHLMASGKRKLESDADDLLHRLGHLADTPLGRAAQAAA